LTSADRSGVAGGDGSPALLEVVPWSYGFAHTWALKWLLECPRTAALVASVALGLDVVEPGAPVSNVRTEAPVIGARADLAFRYEREGLRRDVAIETKVNDRLRPAQIRCYVEQGFEPVIYAPGSTGLLHRHDDDKRLVGTRWLTGKDLVAALEAVDIPWIVRSYVDTVGVEAAWFDRVLAEVSAGAASDERSALTPIGVARAAAWISEIQACIQRAETDEWARKTSIRVESHDRGLMWDGAWRPLDDADGAEAELFLEFIAGVHVERWTLNIKVGGPDGRRIVNQLDAARQSPNPARPWQERRRPGQASTVWSLDLTGVSPADAVQEGQCARAWMRGVSEHVRPRLG
jgi:hypothetical protein